MGTSRPSGPSGVFWASSTCRHVGAHEDRVHHDSGHGDKFHEIDPHVCPCRLASRAFLRWLGQWCLGHGQILASSALSIFHAQCLGDSGWTGDHKCDRICRYGQCKRGIAAYKGLHGRANISACHTIVLLLLRILAIRRCKICHIQVWCLWPPAER